MKLLPMVFRMNQQDVRNHPHLSSAGTEAGNSNADAIEVSDGESEDSSPEATESSQST